MVGLYGRMCRVERLRAILRGGCGSASRRLLPYPIRLIFKLLPVVFGLLTRIFAIWTILRVISLCVSRLPTRACITILCCVFLLFYSLRSVFDASILQVVHETLYAAGQQDAGFLFCHKDLFLDLKVCLYIYIFNYLNL